MRFFTIELSHYQGRRLLCRLPSLALLVGFALSSSPTFAQAAKALRIDLQGLDPLSSLVGLPIHWSDYDAALLERTGRIHLLDRSQMAGHQLLDVDFLPQSLSEARAQLQAQLGRGFETMVTGPYVIAAPIGQAARWRDRFSALLAGYMRYFQVRGWQLRQPDFPLCVVVFPTREEFTRFAAREAGRLPSNVIGSYFPRSNQCICYQLPGGTGTDWSETEATIVHEAVHQLAYNTGIHERLFRNPLWCVEGLACMFEEPAVYDLRLSRTSIADRMSRTRVASLRSTLNNTAELEAQLSSLIASDNLFRSDADQAYSLAWALTFYLSERMPSEYERYLQMQSQRGFGEYTSGERINDFRSAIGTSPGMLAIQMQRLFTQ